MDRKIGIIASDPDLKESIEKLYRDDIRQGKIIIDILDSEAIEEQGKLLEKKGVKAIIARSGGYHHSVNKVNIPLFHLKITTLDILYAIKTASKLQKDIVLMLSHLESFDCNEWGEMTKQKVILETFQHGEIKEKLEKYANQDNVVIVGGGIPCSIAKQFGLNYVHIGASDESIHEAISHAKEMIEYLYQQKYQNEVLKTTLNQVHDAVVAINRDSRILFYNQRAEELLKRDKIDVMNQNVKDVFPELSFMMNIFNHKMSQSNKIINLKKLTITANASLLEVDGYAVGVLCSFQDITKLQSLEKKIRMELNKKGLVAKYKFENIITQDPNMIETVKKAIKIGLTDSTVIVYGESGTGKEMIVQSIHNVSDRKNEPFVAINCAALSETLLESELFGYEEGAFTGARKGGKPGLFELAHGGTVFLDEINSISLNLQTKLLRVLQEKEVMRIGSDYVVPLDVRIIAASNENLREKVKSGSFRDDLFYRLSILELNIPPLRKRQSDIVPLFKSFLSESSGASDLVFIDKSFETKLTIYSWPGNVRELRNIVERYKLFGEVNLDESELIRENNVPTHNENSENNSPVYNESLIDLKELNLYIEGKVIDMLEKNGLSKKEIGNLLGISRTTLWNKQNAINPSRSKNAT